MKKLLSFLFISFFIIVAASVIVVLLKKYTQLLPQRDKIGVVKVEGVIKDAETTVNQLRELGDDESIKAVVIRVNSPGGGVAPSQEIYQEIKGLKKKKKVLVSMGSVAASGGYYISCAADKIVANPGTLTGSIGVIMEIPNFEELMKKLGIKTEVIKSGKHKDLASSFRELSPEERKILQGVLDDVYYQFVNAVAQGRNMEYEKVKKLADGRIFTGKQAKELGLVDELGGLRHTIKLAADMVGIKGEPKVIVKKKKKGLIDIIREFDGKSLVDNIPVMKLSYIYQ
ncbi:MAG: signal peptide peptidase SppA [Nitrospirae bacterium]|nr:MAG: signal peptide peptidase SppA [Nitrospirota bacterium]